MDFFDVNLQIGRAAVRRHGQAATVAELFNALRETTITSGVAWHIAQRDAGADVGNALISQAIAGEQRLHGCWTIVPPRTDAAVMGNTGTDFFHRMQAARIVALRAFPDAHNYQLNRATFGLFLDEVAERRIPLLMSLHYGMEWSAMHGLLQEYPTLTIILCDLGLWGQDRQSWPLLEQYPNVYVESSLVSLEAGGLEATVHAFGAERILFGSGFPFHYPHAALLDVLHAEITEQEKMLIAAGNAQRLFRKTVVI